MSTALQGASASRIVVPRTTAPELSFELVDGGTWRLADHHLRAFTMVVFYRGLHCPVCKAQLHELERRLGELTERGVEVVAVSGDTRERAEQAVSEWGLEHLAVGFGLGTEDMRRWGLFVSERIADHEPERFGEPALFLIAPDGTVFYEAITSMPWGRPRLDDIIGGIDFVLDRGYPARGEA
jgi:peroxiredoxin